MVTDWKIHLQNPIGRKTLKMGMIAKELFEVTTPENKENNRLFLRDRAFHDWYRFVLSFPPHLVRQYFHRFSLSNDDIVLDPFCGTGTTLVEAKLNLISAIGIEASPMASFASKVKTNWTKQFLQLRKSAETVVENAIQTYSQFNQSILRFTPEQEKIVLSNSISELPLHKCLILLNEIKAVADLEVRNLLLLALAHVAVSSASNLKFGG